MNKNTQARAGSPVLEAVPEAKDSGDPCVIDERLRTCELPPALPPWIHEQIRNVFHVHHGTKAKHPFLFPRKR